MFFGRATRCITSLRPTTKFRFLHTATPVVIVSLPSPALADPNPLRLHVLGDTVPNRELRVHFGKGDWTDPITTERDLYSPIREAIAQYKDIDVVHLDECAYNEPTPEMWKAFGGVQPTHLEMSAGWDEENHFQGLEAVFPPWPLKSMYYRAYIGPGSWSTPEESSPTFPACYAGLETLVLDCVDSLSLYYYPTGGATNLRSLTVVGNDAIGTFAHTVACNPKMLATLRSVTISPSPGHWDDVEDFAIMKSFLHGSQALTHLELAILGDGYYMLPEPDADETPNLSDHLPYLGLYDHFPSSLHSLSFRGPPNIHMFNDLDKWIAKANDPLWLPDLREFAVSLVSESSNSAEAGAPEVEQAQTDGKVAELLAAMKRNRPTLEIQEPRPLDELEYPRPVS